MVSGASADEKELEFLILLDRYLYLPVARFLLLSKKQSDFTSVALQAVFISDLHQSLDNTKAMSNMLLSLENKGFISIDYGVLLEGYDYKDYTNSDVYKYFIQTVKEAPDNFIGDSSNIEFGSMALTESGQKIINERSN